MRSITVSRAQFRDSIERGIEATDGALTSEEYAALRELGHAAEKSLFGMFGGAVYSDTIDIVCPAKAIGLDEVTVSSPIWQFIHAFDNYWMDATDDLYSVLVITD